jgi:hypothetical protein
MGCNAPCCCSSLACMIVVARTHWWCAPPPPPIHVELEVQLLPILIAEAAYMAVVKAEATIKCAEGPLRLHTATASSLLAMSGMHERSSPKMMP